MKRIVAGLATLAGGIAALGAINTWLSWRAGPLESQLPGGTSRFYHWLRDGQVYNVFYKVAGEGVPVVLVHGIDGAGSSFEMRQPFGALQDNYRVYALDLLGFGLSDRPALPYTAADYVDLLEDFLREVVEQPAAIIAGPLSAAFAVQVAARAADRVRALVLICPTGLERLADPPPSWQRSLGSILRTPIIGSTLFNLLVSRASLGYFLRGRTYADASRVTEKLIDAYYCTSHQAGARYAPAAFIAGDLNQSIRDTYPTLTQPIAVVWGRDAQVTPSSDANQFIHANPRTQLDVLGNAGLLPQEERSTDFLAVVRRTLSQAPSTPA